MKIIVALCESRIREIPSIASIDFAFPVILRFQGERLARRRRVNVRTYTHVCVFVYTYIWYGTRVCMSPYVPRTPPHTNTCVVWGKKGVTSRCHDRCVYSVEEKDGVWNASRVVKILRYHRAWRSLFQTVEKIGTRIKN